MKNAFIVSVESNKGPVTAEGVKTILAREWGSCFDGVTFKVEDGCISAVAKLVSDYLDAEDKLHRFEVENDIFGNACSINSKIGQSWKKLSDDVRFKRAVLVENLRLYGQSV